MKDRNPDEAKTDSEFVPKPRQLYGDGLKEISKFMIFQFLALRRSRRDTV